MSFCTQIHLKGSGYQPAENDPLRAFTEGIHKVFAKLDDFQQHRVECLEKVLQASGPAKALRSLLTVVIQACKTGDGPLVIDRIRKAKDDCFANTQLLDTFTSTLHPALRSTLQQAGNSKRLLRLVADLNCSSADAGNHSTFTLDRLYNPEASPKKPSPLRAAPSESGGVADDSRFEQPLAERIKEKVKVPGRVIRWDKGFAGDGSYTEPAPLQKKKYRSKKSALSESSGAAASKRVREKGSKKRSTKKAAPPDPDELGVKRGRENIVPTAVADAVKVASKKKTATTTKKTTVKVKRQRKKKKALLALQPGQKTLSSMWR